MQQRLDPIRPSPIAFAHRGARAHAPENTVEAFQLALRLGANGLETDAWLTRDGVVVLDHDGVVRRRGRRVPIAEVDRADLPVHVPSIEEFFSSVGTEFDLSVDVRATDAMEPLVDAALASGFSLSRLWLCFHRKETVLWARQQNDSVRIVDSTRLDRITEGVERRAAWLADHGIDAINMHHTDWSGGLSTLFHRFGVHSFGWDTQVPRILVDALRMGLDAVYSDNVDLMVDAYRSVVGHLPDRPPTGGDH